MTRHKEAWAARLPERFWSKVEKTDGGCWVWRGSRTLAGYGQVNVMGARRYTHHVSLELHGRAVPPGAVVLHTCDNPPCVNPAHLVVGTHADNVADKIAKGRAYTSPRFNGCRRGHPHTPENTQRYFNKRAGDYRERCVACHRESVLKARGKFRPTRDDMRQDRAGGQDT